MGNAYGWSMEAVCDWQCRVVGVDLGLRCTSYLWNDVRVRSVVAVGVNSKVRRCEQRVKSVLVLVGVSSKYV